MNQSSSFGNLDNLDIKEAPMRAEGKPVIARKEPVITAPKSSPFVPIAIAAVVIVAIIIVFVVMTSNKGGGEAEESQTSTSSVASTSTSSVTAASSDGVRITFKKPTDWSNNLCAYIFEDQSSEKVENAAFPGLPMKDEGNGEFSYTLPSNLGNESRVVFVDADDKSKKNEKKFPKTGSLKVVNGKSYDLYSTD